MTVRLPAVNRRRRMSDRMNAYSISRGNTFARSASGFAVALAPFLAWYGRVVRPVGDRRGGASWIGS